MCRRGSCRRRRRTERGRTLSGRKVDIRTTVGPATLTDVEVGPRKLLPDVAAVRLRIPTLNGLHGAFRRNRPGASFGGAARGWGLPHCLTDDHSELNEANAERGNPWRGRRRWTRGGWLSGSGGGRHFSLQFRAAALTALSAACGYGTPIESRSDSQLQLELGESPRRALHSPSVHMLARLARSERSSSLGSGCP
jgi:hypothetical protein